MPETALRSRQTQFTRDAVMEALGHVIAEQGVADFSVQDVADRAGVSHRTVYRHYPSREALLAALVTWGEEQMAALGAAALPETPDEIGPLLRRKFGALDQLNQTASIVPAVLRLEAAKLAHAHQSALSRQATRSALARTTAHLPPDLADAVIALIRQIASSRMWLTLREEEDIKGGRSADVATWAVETLIKELRAGRGPVVNGS